MSFATQPIQPQQSHNIFLVVISHLITGAILTTRITFTNNNILAESSLDTKLNL